MPEAGTITRVPLWINGRAASSNGTRSGAVTNPATGEVIIGRMTFHRIPFPSHQ